MTLPSLTQPWMTEHCNLLALSYLQWTGRELLTLPGGRSLAEEMFEAPFALLSCGAESDPILNYGNRLTLRLWEMSWDELTRTPGRLTAKPDERKARESFLHLVQSRGFLENYEGIRISKSGKRFRIQNAAVWNLIDQYGKYQGQAAKFHSWCFL